MIINNLLEFDCFYHKFLKDLIFLIPKLLSFSYRYKAYQINNFMLSSKQIFIYEESSDQDQTQLYQYKTSSLKNYNKKDINKLIFQQFSSSQQQPTSNYHDRCQTQMALNNDKHQTQKQTEKDTFYRSVRLSNCLTKFDSQQYSKSIMIEDGPQQVDYDKMKVIYKQSPLTLLNFNKISPQKAFTTSIQVQNQKSMPYFFQKKSKSKKHLKKRQPKIGANFFKQLNFQSQTSSKIKCQIKNQDKDKREQLLQQKDQILQEYPLEINQVQQQQVKQQIQSKQQLIQEQYEKDRPKTIRLIQERQKENPQFQQSIQDVHEEMKTQACFDQSTLGNILIPTEIMRNNQKIIIKQISNSFTPQSLKNFNLTPIPQQSRLVFQVHLQKGFFNDKYQLWLCESKQKSLVLTAISDNLKIQSKNFTMEQPYMNDNQGILCGVLQSNFKRSNFTLYDKDQNKYGYDTKILGSFSAYSSLSNKPKLDVYLPKVKQNNITSPIYCNSISKDLKQINRICQTKHIIQKWYNFSIIPSKEYQAVSEQFGLINSAKNLLLTDGLDLKLYIGKMASKKYKIIAGSGISPIQILSVVVTHVEN